MVLQLINILRCLHTVFQKLDLLAFLLAVFRNFFFSTCPLELLFPIFLISMRWCLIVALTCISLINNYSDHTFICLLVIYKSSLEKCLFRRQRDNWLICPENRKHSYELYLCGIHKEELRETKDIFQGTASRKIGF